MTLSQLYRQCRRQLTHDTADFDLSQLFHAQFERSPGLSRAEAEVADDEAFVFRRKVKRLAEGYPLQYLLGEWEFYSIPLKVGEGVLIPRPDTETVVDAALALAARMETPEPVIADFCAGSGAIALALAKHLPGARLLALELSPVALDYLRQNVIANRMGGRIEMIEADVLHPPALPPLDMIVANPPYLTTAELEGLSEQVRCEPVMALDGGEDGLTFYRAIAKSAIGQLKAGGVLAFEAGWQQAGEIAGILAENGFERIEKRNDLNGIERCVFGYAPER